MSWFYEIRGSNNRLVEARGGFAAEKEAQTAGRERAKEMTSSVGYPGGTEVLSMTVGRAEYTIARYDSAKFDSELELCHEDRNGPSRHVGGYVVSNPSWNKSFGWCKRHLDKVADEDPNLRAAWEKFKQQPTS